MEFADAKLSAPPDKLLNVSRVVTLLGSVLVTLSAGTNYIYSAYAPQLGARLQLSHTTLNVIGLAGNMGVSIPGPVWGRIVDRKGPRIPLISASVCLLAGYLGMKQMYDNGIGNGTTVSALHLILLVACNFLTGMGGCAGAGAAINTTAKSFPSTARATTTGLVLSGFGLSAFWFSFLAHTLFPGNTSGFLLVLALGTALPMLIGLFIVKPIPLPPTSSNVQYETMAGGYEPIPSGDAAVFELESSLDAEADMDSASFLPHERDQGAYRVPVPEPAIELKPRESSQRERDVGDRDGLPDIYGKRLWLTPDFFLIFIIVGICGGTGLMYINNVGSITQALYAKAYTVYDDVEASKWQGAQVSILSLGNCAGRILMGLVSDVAYTRFHLPRAYCLCIVSCLFIISQVTAMTISSVEALWIATLLLGLAYGSLFGSCPTIVIEWFGLAHFTENMGYISFSPIIGGNLFSLMFGRNLDTHVPMTDVHSSSGTPVLSSARLVSRGLSSERLCFDGKACYLGSLQVTLVACIISLGLSWYAGIRDGQKIKSRNERIVRA